MSNFKLKKKLKINVKTMLTNESKDLSAENIEKWKTISSFLYNRCLDCNSCGNNTLHLLLTKNNEIKEHAESKKLGLIPITTSDIQMYARQCDLKFGLTNTFCILTW